MAQSRSLADILASTSEFLFPDQPITQIVTVQSRDSDGDTPLHIIAWQGDLKAAETLIDAGADVNAVGDMGYTPLHVAISQNNVALGALLLRRGARYNVTSELSGTAYDMAIRKGGELAKLFKERVR
jgi:ankyrin repeat protein